MKRTLIIHPEDKSTDFLYKLYEPIKEKTIIKGGVSRKELIKLVREHDIIMMMGHGSPYGLFSVGKFYTQGGYVIDLDFVKHLRDKECVYIWCYASDFVRRHKLCGFSTGMFISEVSEAMFCNIKEATQEMVDDSNDKFVTLFNEAVATESELPNLYERVKNEYSDFAKGNKVAEYNSVRLCLFEYSEK